MIPNDPVMLLSFVNMKLRDKYASLDDMCEDLDISSENIVTAPCSAIMPRASLISLMAVCLTTERT